MGQKNNSVKNFKLLQKALGLLKFEYKCLSLGSIPREDIVNYINAADVCVLTSLQEGSPVVIREAMACNRPIVSVDVGDVKQLLDDVDGCFVTRHNAVEIAESIKEAVRTKTTDARRKMIDLKLDSKGTAERIIEIYRDIL